MPNRQVRPGTLITGNAYLRQAAGIRAGLLQIACSETSVASGRSCRHAAGALPRPDLPLECRLSPNSDDNQTPIGLVRPSLKEVQLIGFGKRANLIVITAQATMLRTLTPEFVWVVGADVLTGPLQLRNKHNNTIKPFRREPEELGERKSAILGCLKLNFCITANTGLYTHMRIDVSRHSVTINDKLNQPSHTTSCSIR